MGTGFLSVAMLQDSRAGCKEEGGAIAAVLTSLTSLVLILQLIINVANSNNNRKNENNNNNNDNNNNNINEGVVVQLNEYVNEVMAVGMDPGRSLDRRRDWEAKEEVVESLPLPQIYLQALREVLQRLVAS